MSDTRHGASGEESLEPLNVPHLAAGTFMIQSTGTEVLLILQSARPLADKNRGVISERTVNQPIAVVSISPGTAKDLLLLLGDAVAKHEDSFGPISTPFTTRRDAEQSSSPSAHFGRAIPTRKPKGH